MVASITEVLNGTTYFIQENDNIIYQYSDLNFLPDPTTYINQTLCKGLKH